MSIHKFKIICLSTVLGGSFIALPVIDELMETGFVLEANAWFDSTTEVDHCSKEPYGTCVWGSKGVSSTLGGGKFGAVTDGSSYESVAENSCGIGNPCSESTQDDRTAQADDDVCEFEQAAESEIDQLAQEIARLIAEMVAENNSIEYGTFIVDFNGNLTALTIQPGDGQSIPMDLLLTELRNMGLNESHIRGIIHSHPDSGVTPDSFNYPGGTEHYNSYVLNYNFINGFPSDNDAASFAELADRAEEVGADINEWINNFSGYVIDPEGILREFEVGDRPSTVDINDTTQHNLLETAQADAGGRC